MKTDAFPLQWPQGWPRTPAHRRKFNWQLSRVTLAAARVQLYEELRLLGATHVVLSTNIPLRQDGEFHSKQRPEQGEPGVAVYFQLRQKPMAMARDAFETVEQNLRSLGLAVEHLRGLERHGGAVMLERAFAGFTALPPPENSAPDIEVDWREELGPFPDELEDNEILALCEVRWRNKAKKAHPDQGGDPTDMIRLNLAIKQARDELGG